MSLDFDSLTNRGEYLAAHYFAEQLDQDLKKGFFESWTRREGDEHDPRRTPRQLLRELRGEYLSDFRRPFAAAALQDAEAIAAGDEIGSQLRTYSNPLWTNRIRSWHRKVLGALGFAPGPDRDRLTMHRAGREHEVSVAWHGDGIVALDCGWAAAPDTALDADGPARLLHPLRVSAGEFYPAGPALATWLFQSRLGGPDGAYPRFVLLLCGGVLVLADRRSWAEGRFLAANLDVALERNDQRQLGELALIAALFSREMLTRAEDGEDPPIDLLLKASTENAVGVSSELRAGLRRSVEIIANEVLARLDAAGAEPRQVENPRIPFARELTRETLRYLYRILFLLYAEARPELGILPADDGSYEAGYSVARLRDLVERDEQLPEEESRNGFHLFASLDLLFDKVNNGHRPYGTEPGDDLPGDDAQTRVRKAKERSEDRGLRFEPLRSELFEPAAIRLIGRSLPDPRYAEDDPPRRLDLRLRNVALHEVLRLLTMKKASRRGDRGGFISYRNLGINQLGAVYEGLMSYTGIIANEELCEVAKGGDPEKGSWLIPAKRQTEYPPETLVHYDEHDMRRGRRGPKRYQPGEFVYRLSGRYRETTASYYTPESLTRGTVELALKHRLDQEREADGTVIETPAAELLRYRICEPALGSGAFLNEAINQVAEEYLRRRQKELGVSIPAADLLTEKQKIKAYIALHNAYGVDLNETGVELAEVSLWLNTMHPGMQAPWFGLHLRRGNSLIGARRAVYAEADIDSAKKEWLRAKDTLTPTTLPFRHGEQHQPLPKGAVHHFLLPTPGWAAVTGSTEAKKLAKPEVERLAAWRKGVLRRPAKNQPARLRDAARRAEFLWSLVIRRTEISEDAIARRIDVWGDDPKDPAYKFLHRPAHAVPKEKVFEDLFNAVDTPYWRLKTVMDAWCALWFWPAAQAGQLDGTASAYAERPTASSAAELSTLLGGALLVDEDLLRAAGLLPSAPDGRYTAATLDLFETVTVPAPEPNPDPAGDSVDRAKRKQPGLARDKKPTVPPRRPVIALKDLDDWLDFLEAMLGTSDVPAGTLIERFTTLDALKEFEKQLPGFMNMDSSDPEQRFPWLHTANSTRQCINRSARVAGD
ncbi:hypothetical protein AB1484_26300 [Parafrankia sp. FMc6]|uniref:hypothetical protein n=1 Tax=Parafrankia soli TaxID=2599596 RepID=UPI0034D5D222